MIIFKMEDGVQKYLDKVIYKLKDPNFIKESASIYNFDPRFTAPSNVTGHDILAPILETKTEFLRIGFYTQNWWAYKVCPVNGYVDGTGRNMFLNTRNLWRSMESIEETIWHELVHVSDSINRDMVYWHGDNKLTGKSNTAPVKFAKWAANFKL